MDKYDAFRLIFGWAPCPNCDDLSVNVTIRKGELLDRLDKILTAVESQYIKPVVAKVIVNGTTLHIYKKPLKRLDIIQLANYESDTQQTITFHDAEGVMLESSELTGRTDGCLGFNDTRRVIPKDGTHFNVVHTGNA